MFSSIASKPNSRLRFVKPMLATLVAEPFNKAGWFFEIKWDGYRAIAEIANKSVRLYSRNQISFAYDYPPLVDALKRIKGPAVLDGEIVVVDEAGKPSFQLLQKYRRTGHGELRFYAFDLLSHRGQDLRKMPLRVRKERLQKLVKGHESLYYSDHVEDEGISYFKAVADLEMEGIIAKEADSRYEEGVRSKSWLKIKIHHFQEAVIGGFTKPTGTRQRFGALVVGYYYKGKLIYAGHTGGGFDQADLDEVYQQLRPLIQSSCPFAVRPKTNTPATWVKPKLVCQVRFQEWTNEWRMRHPIFLGLRNVKAAVDVLREMSPDV